MYIFFLPFFFLLKKKIYPYKCIENKQKKTYVGEWAEIEQKVFDIQGKKVQFKIFINPDRKQAGFMNGDIGSAGLRPLVSTNVPKSKFCDLSFEVGQDGTYFYTFDDRMDNLAKMEAFLTNHQKEKGKNPEENHRYFFSS